MNHVQISGRKHEADRLKLQMGLDPSLEIDMHRLRAMWRQLVAERRAGTKAARDFRSIRRLDAAPRDQRRQAANNR